MTVKADALRKRLLTAGLTADATAKYFDIFRAFLSARMTKIRFEDEMFKLFPRDKVHVHNEIVQDILCNAQQKREGLRDLPVVTPVRDRKPAVIRRTPALKPVIQVKSEAKTAKVGQKRPLDDSDSTASKPALQDEPGHKRHKRNNSKKGDDKVKTPKAKISEKASPKVRRKPGDSTPSLPPPSPAAVSTPRLSQMRQAQSGPTEIPTYDGLPYFPVRPGRAMDVDAFLKVRGRMRRIAEMLGMGGVKDDAAALMVHALEAHVKGLLDGAAASRVGRDGLRPEGNLVCGPIRGYDVREAALRNRRLLGDESGMELERLLLLL